MTSEIEDPLSHWDFKNLYRAQVHENHLIMQMIISFYFEKFGGFSITEFQEDLKRLEKKNDEEAKQWEEQNPRCGKCARRKLRHENVGHEFEKEKE